MQSSLYSHKVSDGCCMSMHCWIGYSQYWLIVPVFPPLLSEQCVLFLDLHFNFVCTMLSFLTEMKAKTIKLSPYHRLASRQYISSQANSGPNQTLTSVWPHSQPLAVGVNMSDFTTSKFDIPTLSLFNLINFRRLKAANTNFTWKLSLITQLCGCELKIYVFTLHESSCDSFGDHEPQIENRCVSG